MRISEEVAGVGGYKVERRSLRKHADGLRDLQSEWSRTVQDPILAGDGNITQDSVTIFGDSFIGAFDALIADYVSYVGGVRDSLVRGAAGLELAARTYGQAEEETQAEIRRLAEPRFAKPGGIQNFAP